jgi:hypothetical protein
MSPTVYEPLFSLDPVADDVWIANGPVISFYGLPFPTRMTVIRLVDGSLFVHSPIALDDGLRAQLDPLGPVRHLIGPNWIHYYYLPDWQAAYPGSRTYAAPGVRERAAKYRRELSVDETLDSVAPAAWAGQIDQLLVEGHPVHHEVVFFHRASRTLVLTDLIEAFEPDKMPLWTRPLLCLGDVRTPGQMPRDMRLTFRLNGRADGVRLLRAAAQQMIAWAPERVIIAHGRWYDRDGTSELRRAFRWVLPAA